MPREVARRGRVIPAASLETYSDLVDWERAHTELFVRNVANAARTIIPSRIGARFVHDAALGEWEWLRYRGSSGTPLWRCNPVGSLVQCHDELTSTTK